jgi:hypothetical protein
VLVIQLDWILTDLRLLDSERTDEFMIGANVAAGKVETRGTARVSRTPAIWLEREREREREGRWLSFVWLYVRSG